MPEYDSPTRLVPRDRGAELLFHPSTNKGTAFTEDERRSLGLRGLLPPRVSTLAQQQQRVLEGIRRKGFDIEKYIALRALQDRNERLFYRTLIDNIDELMPLVYTPTVGQACREFAHIFRRPRGLYVTAADRGEIGQVLENWPEHEVRAVVVTDGERILGLGDLGANGMGIPIGKLALYTACAGIAPQHCLPIMLDVGTDNEELRADPLYLGVPSPRVGGDQYLSLLDELVESLEERWPGVLIQFEDFSTVNAYRLLKRYRDSYLTFNDDIQGTAAVGLAGLFASTRISDLELREMRVMFLGAGAAATGIGDLLVEALVEAGLGRGQAMERVSLIDSEGLVVRSRRRIAAHKERFARDGRAMNLLEAIESLEPHALIGATGVPGTFTREVVEAMSAINERPTIFALSNPTSNAEATAEQVYAWSGGRAIFASGSPFAPVEHGERLFHPGQGNNAYIFPGVGLGALSCRARRVTDGMFLAAARALADRVTVAQLEQGAIYPPLSEIRDISLDIACAVAQQAHAEGVAGLARPDDLRASFAGLMYDPRY